MRELAADTHSSLEKVSIAFSRQIEWCKNLGSPFTARVLTVLAIDIAEGGVTADLVRDWPTDPQADVLPLRFAGSLHALVLTGATRN